jgi:hypothetical protein
VLHFELETAKPGKHQLHRLFGIIILRHVQPKTTLIGFQIRQNCPILGIYL